MPWMRGLALAGAMTLSSGAVERPDVLLIVSDDQGYNDLGVLGNGIITPNLDRLAREGVRLTNFYVAWPACTPSRASLLTGRYPQRHGISDMIRNEAPDYGYKYPPAEYDVTFERIGGMDVRERILPALLKPGGYASGIYGKWDLGSLQRFLPTSRGFDDFYGFVNTGIDYYTHERYGVPSMYRGRAPTTEDEGTYCTNVFGREARRFLGEQAGQRPFLCYVPFNAPHGSSALEPEIRSTVQAPREFQEMYPAVEPEFEEKKFKYGGVTRVVTSAARRRDYRAAVTCMDAEIGKMLALLEERGRLDQTIIIFFSDNGGSGGADNAPLRGHKSQMWEGGIRVPCLVRWPGGKLPAGSVCDAFLTSLELAPSLAAACGVELDPALKLDGYDWWATLRGEAPSPRQEMFWVRRDQRAARVGDWKWVDMGGKQGGLFHLAEDVGETRDLSAERPEMLEKVKARFEAWTREMEAAEPRGPFRDF